MTYPWSMDPTAGAAVMALSWLLWLIVTAAAIFATLWLFRLIVESRDDVKRLLDERLASGDITPEDYRSRLALLGR
jgi:uncharacterized membrane protein